MFQEVYRRWHSFLEKMGSWWGRGSLIANEKREHLLKTKPSYTEGIQINITLSCSKEILGAVKPNNQVTTRDTTQEIWQGMTVTYCDK